MTGAVLLVSALALSGVLGAVWQRRQGRLRPTSPPSATTPDLRDVLDQLGERPGPRATLLQFSSAFCAPCRATTRVLTEVTGMVEGVAHVEVDAEHHLEIVRRLDIRKTPTTLVLDADLREISRASGQPRKADVIAALGEALPS